MPKTINETDLEAIRLKKMISQKQAARSTPWISSNTVELNVKVKSEVFTDNVIDTFFQGLKGEEQQQLLFELMEATQADVITKSAKAVFRILYENHGKKTRQFKTRAELDSVISELVNLVDPDKRDTASASIRCR